MNKTIIIGNKEISSNSKTFIIAELSGNHNHDFWKACELIKKAKEAGADAVKLQTYTPDTITIDCNNKYFQINQDTIWDGKTLYNLYKEAYTPWEWQPKLKKLAEDLGLICFSSPFDLTSVEFLENMDVLAYKIASFEINDIPLIKKVASKNKPILISTGISYLSDIDLALKSCNEMDNDKVILLKCTSSYPALHEDINLNIIPNMASTFNCIVGLSDHTLGCEVAVAAVAMGAKVIEKHLTLDRKAGGTDASFSMEPDEFKQMVISIRNVEKALGKVTYDLGYKALREREHSRSLFVVEDIKKGDILTCKNVRSIRPAFGLHTKYYDDILGKKAKIDIKKGTPLSWGLID